MGEGGVDETKCSVSQSVSCSLDVQKLIFLVWIVQYIKMLSLHVIL